MIQSISEDRFNSYNIQRHPMSIMFGTEKKWFESKENNLIGTIIKDNFDNDWAYIILAMDSDREYRAIEIEASMDSEEVAKKRLKLKLSELVDEGEFKEELYNDDKTDTEESSIIITDINAEVKRYFKQHPEKLYDLTPRKFEELVASILEDMGLTVQLTQATRDGGSDIIAEFKNAISNFLMLVECKRYSPENKVGVGIIREVAGVHSFKKPSKSIIVTTSTFTKDARNEASVLKEQIDLKDYHNLKEWLSKY